MPHPVVHDVTPRVQQALDELRGLTAATPAIAAHAALLADILPIVGTADGTAQVVSLSAEHAQSKLRAGQPLLRDEPIRFDQPAFVQRWCVISQAVGRHADHAEGTRLAGALQPTGADPQQLVLHVLGAQIDVIRSEAASRGLNPQTAEIVLRLALFGVFAGLNEATQAWREGIGWPHGHCPVCGSWPLLGEFRGLQQTRFLRCGLCAAEWEFPRLQCPYCSLRDHRQLGFFSVGGQEARYRCATCDGCQGYIKMVQTLDRLSGPQLLVYDVATLPLDLAAANCHYRRP